MRAGGEELEPGLRHIRLGTELRSQREPLEHSQHSSSWRRHPVIRTDLVRQVGFLQARFVPVDGTPVTTQYFSDPGGSPSGHTCATVFVQLVAGVDQPCQRSVYPLV